MRADRLVGAMGLASVIHMFSSLALDAAASFFSIACCTSGQTIFFHLVSHRFLHLPSVQDPLERRGGTHPSENNTVTLSFAGTLKRKVTSNTPPAVLTRRVDSGARESTRSLSSAILRASSSF